MEIAIGILRADPKEDVTPARGWALDIIEKNSGVPFSQQDREALLRKPLSAKVALLGVWGDRGCGRFPRLAGSNDEEGRLPGDETARIESIDHAVPNVRSKASLRSRGADCSAPKSFRIKASSELRPDL